MGTYRYRCGNLLNYDRQSYWFRISGTAIICWYGFFIYIYFLFTVIISRFYIYLPPSIYSLWLLFLWLLYLPLCSRTYLFIRYYAYLFPLSRYPCTRLRVCPFTYLFSYYVSLLIHYCSISNYNRLVTISVVILVLD